MKKLHPLFAAFVIATAVAACQDEAPTAPPQTETVTVPDEVQADINECPRADGEECK